MYFDPRPKRRREDLYGRDRELEQLLRSARSNPLTVVTGIRRIGKTSLILVALSEMPGVLIDLRGIGRSFKDLYIRIESSLNEFFREHSSIWKRLRNELRKISGVQVLGYGISLSWNKERTDLLSLLKSLEEEDIVLALDEVQNLRGPLGRWFSSLLAYLYDHSDLRMILSGSEVGLLYDFLGVENPEAPLYGRFFEEIRLERFDRGNSLSFLSEGFSQAGIDPPRDILERAIEKLDGIVGWLVYFGWKCLRIGGVSEKILDDVLEEASELALREFEHFLEKHEPAGRRLRTIAEAIARGRKRWNEIKEFLEDREGRRIQQATLARLLRTLEKSSYLEKIVDGRNVYYSILDPVLEYALRR